MTEQEKEKTSDSESSEAESKEDDTTQKLIFFPSQRVLTSYPWQVWIVGWLAIFKGLMWLATNPDVPDHLLNIFAFKYVFFMIPFIVLGIGIWNFKKWSVLGIIVLCVADLIFFIVIPQASGYIAGKNHWAISAFLLLCNGPVGNVVILVLSPFLLKNIDKQPVLKIS